MRNMVRLSLAILLIFTFSSFAACSKDDPAGDVNDGGGTVENNGSGGESDDNNDGNNMDRNITITVNGTAFAATLADNATAAAFAKMLPLTLEMDELNGNEKYHYLDSSLPVDAYSPGTINAGDLMLYGQSCVVLFYDTFTTGYSYSRIGKVDNPDGLAAALGRGSASITFEAR